MNKIFENPILVKIQQWGQKIGSLKFIAALQAGMMSVMSILMIGAICQIIATVGQMFNLWTNQDAIYSYIYTPYNYTMGLIGVWATLFISYNYAKNLKMKNPLIPSIDATLIFLLTCAPITNGNLSISYLGASGMFIGFFISFAVVRIENFCKEKNIRIKMPDICPPSLVNAFGAILPLAINVLLFQGVNIILLIYSDGTITLPILVMKILQMPLNVMLSLPGIFIICTLALILWCFGIHGTMIAYPILAAAMMEAAAHNAVLHEAGLPLEWFPVSLFGYISVLGGTGNTFPLCLMGLFAKSKQIKAVSKAAIIPSWFGINEPCTFGMPIMYNPILCIPYVLNSLVLMILTVLAFETGFIIPSWISMNTLMPMGFGQYFTTLNIWNSVFVYLLIIPSFIIWYPFFRIYDQQCFEKEQNLESN